MENQNIKIKVFTSIIAISIASFTLPYLFPLQTFFLPVVAQAASPQIISYQGRLADSSGSLLGGSGTNYFFKFSIWDNPTVGSGTKVWPAGAPGVTTAQVTDGVFNVNIGDTANGFPDALNFDFNSNPNVYLQVEASADNATFETLSPRQQITSSGFAINANAVGGHEAGTAADNVLTLNNSGDVDIAGKIITADTIQGGSGLTSGTALAINTAGAYTGNLINLSVNGTSEFSVTEAGNVLSSGTLTVGDGAGNDYLAFNAEATNPSCATSDYKIWANSISGTLKKCEDGVISDLGSGAGSASSLQQAYDAGAGITSADGRDLAVVLSDTTTDSNFLINIATGSTSKFAVQNNGTDVFRVTSSGALVNSGNLTLNNAIVIGGDTISGFTGSGLAVSSGVLNNTGVLSVSCTTITCSGTNPATFSIDNGAIGNSQLANSSITVTGGPNISVSGSPVALGGTINVGTVNNPNFSTSVTSPLVTGTGAVTVSSGGTSDLTLDSASDILQIAASDTTLRRTAAGTYTIDLSDAGNTTLDITNSGAGNADLTVDGNLTAANFSGSSSGANTGDQTINLTGDVTGTGTGSFATAIGIGKVTSSNILDGTVANSDLANSSITLNTSAPLGGGGSVALGGNLTLTCSTCITSGANLLTLAGSAGTPQTISQGGTLTVAAGSGITTTAGATGTITIASTLGTSVDLTSEVSGILPATNGGTGSGFTQFTGPATSTKIFTLPNASATILTDASAITDAQISDTLTIGSSGTVDWTALNNYPAACAAGKAITSLGDTVTCSTFATSDTNTTYTSGSGLSLTGTTFSIDAAFPNTFSALQSYSGGLASTENGNTSTSYAFYGKRNTDTSPAGMLLQFQNAAANANLFTIDVAGNATGGTYNTATISGGTLSTTSVNGVNTADIILSTGSYADPSFLTSLAGSKISGDISGNAGNVTGTVAVGNGGTGVGSFTAGGIVLGGTTLSDTGVLSNGQLLIGDGTGAPALATLTGGTGIGISNAAGSITINNTDTGSAQNIFKTIAVSAQPSVTANANATTLTIVAGTNVSLATDNTAKSLTINSLNPFDQDLNTTDTPTFTGLAISGLSGSGTQCLEADNTGAIIGIGAGCGTSSGISTLSLTGTSGVSQSLTNGDTITIGAGTGITTTAGATDTVTVAIDS
ncbi:MAG TPA: hypothetical protein VFX17_02215, partial [Patescibacteria group bacterium]|nr:hypothetical protein [Patescibacteria group bacterium]